MILSACCVKFHEKRNEIPFRACRPSKSEEHKYNVQDMGLKSKTKNNVDNVGPTPARSSVRPSGESGGRSPPGREKSGYILIYTYINI